ncbi:response regulator transcription factor [bacterium]|nr:response regulator transcription factor [bacterium]
MKNEKEKSRILLVEDEENLAVGLEYNLTHEGYHVTRAEDGRIALDLIQNQSFDLIIMDIMLPFYDGFELTEIIREKSPQMPILILTARTTAKDRIKGLEIGADDYLTKPFHLQELLLRIRGMLKRKQWYQDVSEIGPVYCFGDNKINFETLVCKTEKQEIRLTPHEAMVIKYLILHKGKIVSRKALLENVWHVSSEVETRTVDSFISRLRKYFETDPSKPVFIKSIRGAGYQFFDE